MQRIGVDVGGTFTDLVVYDEAAGSVVRSKHPTTPRAPVEGVVAACRDAGLDFDRVSLFMHATTIVTNLVITRTGGKIGLITTRGFRDVLEIGRSYRDQLYDPQWDKPRHLVPRYLVREVTERIDHHGRVLVGLDPAEAGEEVRALFAEKVDVIAVCLFNSYANPAHEQAIGELIVGLAPGVPVSLSSEVDPRIREYERVSTTVLNAYAMPNVVGYIDQLDRTVARTVYYMHSGGGIMRASDAKKFPVMLLQSGPAAGVLGAKFVGESIGARNLITADVGGTSFDVCVIRDGEPDANDQVDVEWGIPARIQSIDVRSIGAGGGSIAWIDAGGALRVGPRSAGAVPGPVCYDAGGEEPTVTDANVALGIIDPGRFLGGRLKIVAGRARESLEPIAKRFGVSVEEAALGIYRIVNANMAQAILESTVKKGIDPRDFALFAFGGGGGQHAVEVAREVGIPRVIIPCNPSAFSACGLLTADLQKTTARTVMLVLRDSALGDLRTHFEALARMGREALRGEEGLVEKIDTTYILDVRYVGQSNEVAVAFDGVEGLDASAIYRRFEALHRRLYGTQMGDPAEIVNVRVTVTGRLARVGLASSGKRAAGAAPRPRARRKTALHRTPLPIFDRDELRPGSVIEGPCIIEEPDSTHVVTSGCLTTMDRYGNLIIRLRKTRRRTGRG